MLDRIFIVSRQNIPNSLRVITFVIGLIVGIVISVGVLVLYGVSLKNVLNEFVVFVFFDRAGQAQLLTQFIPLAMVGLAAAASIKLQFWNIGIEGQMWMGATAATFVASYDIGPEGIRIYLMFAAAIIAGTLWIAGPTWLKLRYGINEIVTTLLLSYVAFLFVQSLLFGIWRDPTSGFPASPLFGEAEQLARIGWGNLHQGLWIALGVGVLFWWLMSLSRFGYLMDQVGQNPLTARAAGLPVTATIIVSAMLSGGLAGMAGATIVMGQEYRLTIHIADGFTFSAIVVAFLARFNPIGCLVAAAVLGGISATGETLKVFYQLPLSMVTLIEAILLLSVLIAEFFARYRISIRPKEVLA